MKLQKIRLVRLFSILFVLMFLTWTMPAQSLARAGRGMSGGGSFGSRGSRSTTPVTPYTPPSSSVPRTTPYTPGYQPVTPGRPATPATPYGGMPPASPSPTGGFWRNVGGGLMGGFAGGMLSNWLFGGGGGGGGGTPAQGGASGTAAGGGGGFGFFELILLVGIGYLLYRFLVKKPQEDAAGAPGAYQSSTAGGTLQVPYAEQTPPPTESERDLDTGIGHIKSMDPLFTEEKFKDQAMDFFFKIQGAWSDRDMSTVKHLLTPEMLRLLQEDADKMRQEGQINKIENIAVREVNLTEAWQESGQDYITFRVYANLLDYTINEKTGEIVTGSKTDPVKFEEYWTFTRAVGNNPWQLSAINQAE